MHKEDFHCVASRKYSLSEADVQQWKKDKQLPDASFTRLQILPISQIQTFFPPPSSHICQPMFFPQSDRTRFQSYKTGNINTLLTKTGKGKVVPVLN
jgi:hypothetical protein